MRFSAAAVFSALVALASAHTDPDYNQNPTGNAIISPGLNEIVAEGKSYSIKWTPTTTGPVSLVLLRGPSDNVKPLKTLAESIPNSGEFTWTPSGLTPDTTHYGLLLVVEGTGQYQYSTQFGISAPAGSHISAETTATVAPTTVATRAATTLELTESTTICPETETTASAVSTPAFSTVISSTEVTTTICPETESSTASATSIPVVVPTGVSPVTSKAWTSSTRASTVAPSGTASASPAASSPAFNGAATNAISFGAVFAGVLAAFAI
jgi:hypothetical protein